MSPDGPEEWLLPYKVNNQETGTSGVVLYMMSVKAGTIPGILLTNLSLVVVYPDGRSWFRRNEDGPLDFLRLDGHRFLMLTGLCHGYCRLHVYATDLQRDVTGLVFKWYILPNAKDAQAPIQVAKCGAVFSYAGRHYSVRVLDAFWSDAASGIHASLVTGTDTCS